MTKDFEIKPQMWVRLKNGIRAWVIGQRPYNGIFPVWTGCSRDGNSNYQWGSDKDPYECFAFERDYDIVGPWVDPPEPIEFETKVVKFPTHVRDDEFAWGALASHGLEALAPFIGKRVRVRVELAEDEG